MAGRLTEPDERRRRLREVQEVAAELADVENALADAEARIGPLRSKVAGLRASLERALDPDRR